MLSSQDQERIIAFADKHLFPYKIKSKPNGDELIPEYCPFCHGNDHDRETFSINLNYGVYNCKRGSCGVTGTFATLAENFHEDIKLSSARHGNRPEASAKMYKLPSVELNPCTEEIYKYFEKRKISRETVDKCRVKSDVHGNIAFTFYEDNTLTYVKYRRPRKPLPSESKEWSEPDAKQILWNLDHCSYTQPLYICEGMVDAMSLIESGLTNAASVPSGTSNLDFISNNWDQLERFPYIVLFGDNDIPGKKLISTLVKRLGEDRCRIVTDYPMWPDDSKECKDANEILYYYGAGAVLDMALNPQEVQIKGVINAGEVPYYDPTLVPRIKTMIPAIDKTAGGLFEGGVTVLVGKSGSGKSILADQVVVAALAQNYPVFVYSGEFGSGRLTNWINLQCAGSEYITLKRDPIREEDVPFLPYEVDAQIRKWYMDKLWIYDNDEQTEGTEADSILSAAGKLIRKYGIKLVVIDNLMTAVSDQVEEFAAQKDFANKLKKMARKYGVAVILVCHARKTKAGEQLRKDDVAGSSAMVNISDLAIAVQPNRMDIIKNRDTGILKTVTFCYVPDSRRIYQDDIGDKLVVPWAKEHVTIASPRADSVDRYHVIPPTPEYPF